MSAVPIILLCSGGIVGYVIGVCVGFGARKIVDHDLDRERAY